MTESTLPSCATRSSRFLVPASLLIWTRAWESIVVVVAGTALLLAVSYSAFNGQFFGEDFITRSLYLSANGDFLKAIFTPFGPFLRPAAVAWSIGTQLVLPFDPFIHHLRNFVGLLVLALLLHRVLLRLTESPVARGLGLVLFLGSGIQLTIVGYINCIDNIGALTYGLATLLFLLRYYQQGGWWNYLGALLFFLFSTFSRDANVMFLFALAVLIGFQARETGTPWIRRAILQFLPFVALVALYFIIRIDVVGVPGLGNGANYPAYALHVDFDRIVRLSGTFIGVLLNLSFSDPVVTGQGDLSSWLGLSPSMQYDFRIGFALLGGALMLVTVVLGLRARPLGLFAVAWAGAMLLPSFLIQNEQIYYDFEPLAACALLLGLCVDRAGPYRRWLAAAWLPVLAVTVVNGIAHAGNVNALVWRGVANQNQAIIDQVMTPHRGEAIAALTLIAADQTKADLLQYLVDPPLSPSGLYQAQLKALMSPTLRYFRVVTQADYLPDPSVPQPHLIYRQEADGKTLTRIKEQPSSPTAVIVVGFDPRSAPAGLSQPLPLWLKATHVHPDMTVLWNGQPLASVTDTNQKVVTTMIPSSLLTTPGQVSLSLHDPVTNQESPTVRFEVTPGTPVKAP